LGAYQQSKLANLLFTFEFATGSDAYGWGLMSNRGASRICPDGPDVEWAWNKGLMGALSNVLKVFSHSARRERYRRCSGPHPKGGADGVTTDQMASMNERAVAPAKVGDCQG